MGEHGAISGAGEVRFERLLPGPIERVWSYLTESEKRREWLAAGEIEVRVGGAVELRFQHAELSPHDDPFPDKYREFEQGATSHGRVTRCDPPRLLAFTWSEPGGDDSEVTFELEPRGERVLLVLTHRRVPDAERIGVLAGWHTHLDILRERLAGEVPGPFWSRHGAAEAEYARLTASSTSDAGGAVSAD